MNTAVEPTGLVAELAKKFQVPFQEVERTFEDEFRRLGKDARVHGFVAVLAASHTRAILRCRTPSSQGK